MISVNTLNLISPIPVSVNHYLKPRAFIKWDGKKPKAMVTMYETPEAKEYKKFFSKYVREEVEKQNWNIENTKNIHHYMDCIFYFDRTDKDEQNYYKILCDSINGIAYIDDRKILTRCHEIYYDSNNPRIEIKIKPVEYRGIFDNQNKLNEFIEICEQCGRYKRNCSILNKAIEGKVQEEIHKENNTYICSKFKVIRQAKTSYSDNEVK